MYILSILFVAILGYIIGKVVEILNKKVLKPLFYKLIKEIRKKKSEKREIYVLYEKKADEIKIIECFRTYTSACCNKWAYVQNGDYTENELDIECYYAH